MLATFQGAAPMLLHLLKQELSLPTPFATFSPAPALRVSQISSITCNFFFFFFCILLSDSASLHHRKNALQLTLPKTCHDQVWTWRDMWDWTEPQKLAPKLKVNWVQSQRYWGVGVLSTWEWGRKDGKTFGGSTGNRLMNSGGVKAGNKRIREV